MRLAPLPYFATDGRNCQGAAEALSSIVSGHDFSAHRLDFAFDQHPCRRPYLEQRWACLQDLGLVARAFPLR